MLFLGFEGLPEVLFDPGRLQKSPHLGALCSHLKREMNEEPQFSRSWLRFSLLLVEFQSNFGRTLLILAEIGRD